MAYSNSKLVSFIKISPNKTSPRNHKIDTITIHVVDGNSSIESIGNLFSLSSRRASSNYGIGSDGRIGMYVEEKDRSWCSGGNKTINGITGSINDYRAITIEVANDGDKTTGYHVSDKALASLINLCADICKRNDIKQLLWKNDVSLVGKIDKQNMTVHRWFSSDRACPGDYLMSKHSYIADEVNKIILPPNKSDNPATPVTPIVKPDLQKIYEPDGLWGTYRLYNPNSGEHFYTVYYDEANNTYKAGWNYEGVAWYAPKTGTPVYRLYNPNAGDHHYTMNIQEKESLIKVGWKDEGVAFFSGGNIPIYRAYNPNAKAGAHHYTVSKDEINFLVKQGWKDEGIGWYATR